MRTGDNVYRLVKGAKRKFEPIGVAYEPSYLTPGIWLCTKKPYCFSSQNLDYQAKQLGLYRVGKVPEVDYVKVAQILQLGDKVCDIIYKFEKDHDKWSLQELSNHVASKLIEHAESQQTEH